MSFANHPEHINRKGRPKGSSKSSLLKLQQVMGHSDMKVSLTYLRGLEIAQLKEEDMPNI